MRELDENYKTVPVMVAKQIAEGHQKEIVVILSWDDTYEVLHTTTYGISAAAKEAAAMLGEVAARAAGVDMTRRKCFEDFRTSDAAQSRARIEQLEAEVARLKGEATHAV